MAERARVETGANRAVLIKLGVLFALCVWVFRGQWVGMFAGSWLSGETAQTAAAPAGILLLIYLRRRALAAGMSRGSAWGLVLIGAGLAVHALAFWPFPYGYAHYAAILPVVGGAIVVCCGWRVLKVSGPMLLLLAVALPVGSRIHATMVGRPNRHTLAATAAAIDVLGGTAARVEGADLLFQRDGRAGVVGLGESNRGARLLLSFVAIGVFVTFSRLRPAWRIAMVGILALPVVLLCNFLRFLLWGLLTVYGGAAAESAMPRNVSTIFSVVLAYGVFAFLAGARLNLFVEEGGDGQER